MPEMDGYEATAEIGRREGGARHTPVIAMRAHASSANKAIELGCKHYVVKPIQPEHFVRVIREALRGETPVLREMSDTVSRFGLDPVY